MISQFIFLFLIFFLNFSQESQAIYNQDQRAQILQDQKKQQNETIQKNLSQRSEGRKIQSVGGDIVDVTSKIDGLLDHLPNKIKDFPATTVLSVLNRVANVVGRGVVAYGRRQEGLKAIINTDEQILEESMRSFEKIKLLSRTLADLLGQKTLMDAVQENKDSDATLGRKTLNLLAPSNFMNTFNQFTDNFYITDNKRARWAQVKKAAQDLREEEAVFDDYMAILQIKFLEKMIMVLHRQQNKDVYLKKIEESLEVLNQALRNVGQKINDLHREENKGGMINRLKKAVGRDKESQNQSKIADLLLEKKKYEQEREATEKERNTYQTMSVNEDALNKAREELKAKILDIKGRKPAQLTLENMMEEIETLKTKLQDMENTMKRVHGQTNR